MDVRTGRIYSTDEVGQMTIAERNQKHLKPIAGELSTIQRLRRRIGRNDPCPCGSGKKFKKCCLDRGE